MGSIGNIETYCEGGVWKTRWQHSDHPFASGGGRERQIAQGATVACWYGVDHIIRDESGAVVERNSYRYRHHQTNRD